jgi:HlyD family secretion protein
VKKWQRWAGITLAAVLLATAALVIRTQRSAAQDEADGEIVTATVFVGDLSATAGASGRVVADKEAQLALALAGIVTDVTVEVGQRVQAGDVLVQLDDRDLALTVASAELNVRIQEANLATLLAPPSAADIAAAEAQVRAAEAQLADLLDGPSELQIKIAETNVRSAESSITTASGNLQSTQGSVTDAQIQGAEARLAQAKLQQTQARLANEDNPTFETDQVLRTANEQVAIAQAEVDALRAGPNRDAVGAAQANVASAAARRDAAQADLDALLAGPSATQIAAAESQVAQAQANLDRLNEGSNSAQLESAEAQLEQARINLANAQDTLARAALTAPFDGVVTAVYVSPGEFASGLAVELMADGAQSVRLSVDEIDIGALVVGQPAVITIEAWPTVEIDSVVQTIAPAATDDGSGLVTYDVELTLDTDLPVRAGMTANANLVTANREDVLLLENRAIRVDRRANRYYVDVQVGDTVEEVEITVGLRDAQYTQVTDGLQAGDVVLVDYEPPTFQPGQGPPPGVTD